ncbi:MAG: acyl-CoA dehydratase activase [Myxococcales bacterium]
MKVLETLRARAHLPVADAARAARARGVRPVAVLCGFVPPELVHAAGAQPIRLRSTGHGATDRGATYFAPTHCSLVRRVFDMALREELAGFDAVLLATGCDHSRRTYDAWRHADAKPALRHLLVVSADSTDSAVATFEHELARLRDVLQKAFGVEVTDSRLADSIALYDQQRELLEAVYRERAKPECPLTGADVLALNLVLATEPVEEGNALLEELLRELPQARRAPPQGELRLFLASGHFEELSRMEVLERHGGRVVHDLMCTGTGYFQGRVDRTRAPLAALAERGLRRLSCPHASDELVRRTRFIADTVREWRCDGVVLDRLSFCAIWAAENFVQRRRLKEAGIPVLEARGRARRLWGRAAAHAAGGLRRADPQHGERAMTRWAMGIDVGSLTAKGILLADGQVAASHLSRARPNARESVETVAEALCGQKGLRREDVHAICLTGYGRFQAPFAAIEKSEISCHGLGASIVEPTVRTVVDIGGQDSKVVAVDERGLVQDFAMNDKCAAGTGRALEVLGKALGVEVEALGPLALKGKPGRGISNRCSLFMESDVLQARRDGVDRAAIARAIVEAVVARVLSLASKVPVKSRVCLTGGVAKNPGVAAALERQLGQPLCALKFDPQLIGALGAAHFAHRDASAPAGAQR